ncbi:methylmalonyl-CoA mutase family protein [Fretibacter rubidus]|uniref:methylmalonyl-CoA mutase family protein n=1 Tax=Fretibacter rubidus TaxID=570162 RepID=UPI00352A7EAB
MIDIKTESQFPSITRDDWEALVENGLKSGKLRDLMRKTEDGIIRGPLSTLGDRPDNIAPCPRYGVPLLNGRPWHITAPVRGPDTAFANTQMLEDLKGGASAVRVETRTLPITARNLKRLFEGIYTDLIPICFDRFGPDVADDRSALISALLSIPPLQSAHMNLGLHPTMDIDILTPVIADLPKTWRAFTLNLGETSDVLELATLAAFTVEAMRKGGPEHVHNSLVIELYTNQDAHMGIAKIRAARRIYATIAKSFGLTDISVPIRALNSRRMMQRIDPWSNMLRVMSASFGAVVGGADYILSRPFTDAIGHATPFGHRVARNMQLLMMEESHLGHVSDPAYGSYFHERMTEDLGQAAWSKFQEIEAAGGVTHYQESGAYHADILAAQAAYDRQDAPIVGVTLHPAKTNRTAKVRGAF